MDKQQNRDEWLMAEVAEGKRDALEPLVRRHATPLLSFLQRMAGDRHRGEDLFQEVFLAVWVKRSQYIFPRPFKPWLYAIAVNKCRAAFRQTPWAGPSPFPIPLQETSVPPALEPSPAETAVAVETAAIIGRALTLLPAQQRAVVVLRLWEQLGYDDIAGMIGCTAATARSHMHHGLCALRRYLEPRLL
jgi:RNA polymerase sigma-70 factor (ECF subfamily)